jgi:glucose/arabinose dehydrogenase
MRFGTSGRVSRRGVLMGAGLAAAPLLGRPARAQEAEFTLSAFAEGFERPLFMADPNDGTGRMFVVEQVGHIHVVIDGELLLEPMLNIEDQVTGGSEQGLLGLALHPNFAGNGTLFIDYTDLDGNTQVVRYTIADDNPDRLDPDSAQVVISVEQPARNHNGGMLAFGPDGYFYVSLGDGGNQGDPEGHGQNRGTLLGSILRLDVDSEPVEGGYVIPEDNPFVQTEGAMSEIWHYGLRNPWRFSFDRETGDMWIGDVGQRAFEEVDFQPAGVGGMNFGWSLAEGFECYSDENCQDADIDWPVFAYGRDLGIAVTGGYVYRGEAVPSLAGRYLLGDYGTGYMWVLTPDGDGAYTPSDPIPTDLSISSFAEDAAGELYVIDLSGGIYQIVGS